MVQRPAPLAGGIQIHAQIGAQFILPDEIVQGTRADALIQRGRILADRGFGRMKKILGAGHRAIPSVLAHLPFTMPERRGNGFPPAASPSVTCVPGRSPPKRTPASARGGVLPPLARPVFHATDAREYDAAALPLAARQPVAGLWHDTASGISASLAGVARSADCA